MKKLLTTTLVLVLFIASTAFQPKPEEGMYPISFLESLDLKAMGLKLTAKEIFNEGGNGLINAIVRIGGCTGSFISDNGLILTNHHCVFSSLKPHTSEVNNYMRDGFLAKEKSYELPMKGYTVRIMKSYVDVSEKVLSGTNKDTDPIEKDQIIRKNIKAIEDAEKAANPNYEIEISEMLTGASYILFRYQFLKDLRLVYVPARYIGEFGGETDNWMWPRHSGDFAFVRAYVDKDGNPAEYSNENVPYKPERHLKVNMNGVDKEDLVFVLGYPGRTFRHYPASFIKYMQEAQMPFIANLWESWINEMQELSTKNDALEIKYATRIKSLANTTKNYRGKMQSIRRIELYKHKVEEEEFIYSKLLSVNKKQAEDFKATLNILNRTYDDMIAIGDRRFWYGQLISGSKMNQMAFYSIAFAQQAINSPDAFNKEDALKKLRASYKSIDLNTDSTITSQMLAMAVTYSGQEKINGLDQVIKNQNDVREFINNAYNKSLLNDTTKLFKWLLKKPSKIVESKDLFLSLHNSIFNDYNQVQQELKVLDATIRANIPAYVEAKMAAKGDLFVPDANATLRFTYGHVKGYAPADALYTEPISTLNGILEKGAKPGDYHLEPQMIDAIKKYNNGPFFKQALGSVPVNLLYNTDTSGGNSGSPILNDKGELVGLNFDRCFEACVNDFAWNDDYSRSIGVDIRYILWVTKNIGGAPQLIAELENKK